MLQRFHAPFAAFYAAYVFVVKKFQFPSVFKMLSKRQMLKQNGTKMVTKMIPWQHEISTAFSPHRFHMLTLDYIKIEI